MTSSYEIKRAKLSNGEPSVIYALLRGKTLLDWQDYRNWHPANLANHYHALALTDTVVRHIRGEE